MVKSFFRQLANRVQSGSARTGLDDDATDYYPVPLERKRAVRRRRPDAVQMLDLALAA